MSFARSAALALGLLAAAPAAAHVTLEVQQAPANSTYRAVFRVAAWLRRRRHDPLHGPRCRMASREARPMPKPGWTLRTDRARRGRPPGHGTVAPLAEAHLGRRQARGRALRRVRHPPSPA